MRDFSRTKGLWDATTVHNILLLLLYTSLEDDDDDDSDDDNYMTTTMTFKFITRRPRRVQGVQRI